MLTSSMKQQFKMNGFVLVENLITKSEAKSICDRFEMLFDGQFETGIYPDEWHWRKGISKPDAFREIVNAWKCDNTIAKFVKSPEIAKIACELMDWSSVRVGQDDLLWKQPLGKGVAYHQDSAYISKQFIPRDNNSVTVWIALDDADEETGVVEYCPGSHLWRRSSNIDSATNSTFHAPEQKFDSALRRAAIDAGIANFEIKKIKVSVGSAIFHHQDVWHGSDDNRSTTRPRRALGIHLIDGDVKWATYTDYIYGRYHIPGELRPNNYFFPKIYSKI